MAVIELQIKAEPTFADMLAAFHRQRYTGAVTIHLIRGVPTVLEIPEKPTRIPLRSPDRT